jgi:hypothetical protein
MIDQQRKEVQIIPVAPDKKTVAVRTETREGLKILDSEEVLRAISGGQTVAESDIRIIR